MGAWVRSRLRTRPYLMSSPLTVADLVERLDGRLDPIPRSPFWYPRSGMAYLGQVDGATFRMYPRGLGRNWWRWVYNGSIVADGDRTCLIGTLGPSVGLLMFSVVWVGLVVAFAAVGLVGLLHGLLAGDAVVSPLLLSLGPFVMLAFFVVMSNTGWKSAGREWASMEKWLKATVKATSVEGEPVDR